MLLRLANPIALALCTIIAISHVNCYNVTYRLCVITALYQPCRLLGPIM